SRRGRRGRRGRTGLRLQVRRGGRGGRRRQLRQGGRLRRGRLVTGHRRRVVRPHGLVVRLGLSDGRKVSAKRIGGQQACQPRPVRDHSGGGNHGRLDGTESGR